MRSLIHRRGRWEERAHEEVNKGSERGEEAEVRLALGVTVVCQACSEMD